MLIANGITVASFTMQAALLSNATTFTIATVGAVAAVVARWSAPSDEALPLRAAATALFVATCGTFGWLALVGGEGLAFVAMERASAEMRADVFAEAMDAARLRATWAAVAGALGLLVGAAAMVVARRGATRRTRNELAVSAALVVLLLLLPMASHRLGAIQELMIEQTRKANLELLGEPRMAGLRSEGHLPVSCSTADDAP